MSFIYPFIYLFVESKFKDLFKKCKQISDSQTHLNFVTAKPQINFVNFITLKSTADLIITHLKPQSSPSKPDQVKKENLTYFKSWKSCEPREYKANPVGPEPRRTARRTRSETRQCVWKGKRERERKGTENVTKREGEKTTRTQAGEREEPKCRGEPCGERTNRPDQPPPSNAGLPCPVLEACCCHHYLNLFLHVCLHYTNSRHDINLFETRRQCGRDSPSYRRD